MPANDYGLIDVDEHCRVAGVERVWAAGATVKRRPFDPARGQELAGLPCGQFLETWLGGREPRLSMHVPTMGMPLLTYLQKMSPRRGGAEV